jgi:hypothetical protein
MIRASIFLILFVFISSFQASAQVLEFDKLEMLYSQRHYKKVYRKAGKYMDKPQYDFSDVPSFYRALTMFQLAGNDLWRQAHPNALQDAREIILNLRKSSDSKKIIEAHANELSALKSDLLSRMGEYKRLQMSTEFEELQAIVVELFDRIETIDNEGIKKPKKPISEKGFEFNLKDREEMILFAQNQIGTPYVWSGTSPSGFDCSGFIGYVMKAYKVDLPRRAADQYNSSTKVKEKSVQKGDLVFFDSGSGISHVGMIVSEKDQPLVMVHASSSKGVILTNINESEYWLKRLVGFGTYVDR